MPRRGRWIIRAGALSVVLLLGWAGTASAAFPGRDGQLAIQPVNGPGLILASDNGADVRRICTDASVCGLPAQPAWSPSGRELVFDASASPSAPTSGVKIVDADGNCVNCLYGSARSPSFEPTGEAIAFLRSRGGLGEDGIDGLPTGSAVVPAGTTSATWSADGDLATASAGRIDVRSPDTAIRAVGRGSAPDWSPNSRQLVIVSRGWIWLIGAHGGRARRLVRGAAPVFAPDGRSVAFIAAGHHVETVAVRGGRPRRVGDLTGRSVTWQPLPRTVPTCLTPGGATTLAENAGTLLYAVTAHRDSQPLGSAVMSCLSTQGIPRLVVREAPSSIDSVPAGAVNASAVAVVVQSAVASTGFLYENEAIVAGDAATGTSQPPSSTSANCTGAASSLPPDSNVTPASPCGINDLVVNPSGDWAYELTQAAYPCDAAYSCWSESVTRHTPTGDATLAQQTTDAPSGQSGITDLMASATMLTWQTDGTPESAPF